MVGTELERKVELAAVEGWKGQPVGKRGGGRGGGGEGGEGRGEENEGTTRKNIASIHAGTKVLNLEHQT